ncbi:MAG TPA: DUF1905 domain-containing protein [Candidatus Saccharimonadia bacterium]|jgi:hypothetical protein
MINKTFTGTIGVEIKGSIWPCVLWSESKEVLGTGKATKVRASVDGNPVITALMPSGSGPHMLPISKPLLKKLHKQIGDSVTVVIVELA